MYSNGQNCPHHKKGIFFLIAYITLGHYRQKQEKYILCQIISAMEKYKVKEGGKRSIGRGAVTLSGQSRKV